MVARSVESVLAAKGCAVATVWPWSTVGEPSGLLAGPRGSGRWWY